MLEQLSYWLIAFAVIGLIVWTLVRENSRARRRTAEEFERDLATTKSSLMRAGLVELDKFFGETRQKQTAVEYLKDEQQGQTRTSGKSDDETRTEPGVEGHAGG